MCFLVQKNVYWGESQDFKDLDFIVSKCTSLTKQLEYIFVAQNSAIKVSYLYPEASQPSTPSFKETNCQISQNYWEENWDYNLGTLCQESQVYQPQGFFSIHKIKSCLVILFLTY